MAGQNQWILPRSSLQELLSPSGYTLSVPRGPDCCTPFLAGEL